MFFLIFFLQIQISGDYHFFSPLLLKGKHIFIKLVKAVSDCSASQNIIIFLLCMITYLYTWKSTSIHAAKLDFYTQHHLL